MRFASLYTTLVNKPNLNQGRVLAIRDIYIVLLLPPRLLGKRLGGTHPRRRQTIAVSKLHCMFTGDDRVKYRALPIRDSYVLLFRHVVNHRYVRSQGAVSLPLGEKEVHPSACSSAGMVDTRTRRALLAVGLQPKREGSDEGSQLSSLAGRRLRSPCTPYPQSIISGAFARSFNLRIDIYFIVVRSISQLPTTSNLNTK